jgi:hypothetical protein
MIAEAKALTFSEDIEHVKEAEKNEDGASITT